MAYSGLFGEMTMNKVAKIFRAIALALSLSFVCGLATAQSLDAIANAAVVWLKKLDAKDVQGAWQSAAPSLRTSADLAAFGKTIQEKRISLGAVKGRGLTALELVPTQANEAQKIAVTFRVGFDQKVTSETAVLQQQPNGQWLVTAYLLR